ncbi:GGDEF domain-containing protein [Paenibacillus pini]|uniref:GGDEF domain protein n=1 Tax=Paenibacillus pini JCM 16418 TaxID=1236976 RepID=W7YFA3_9BACL|nr:GGDEF domain-containing protein [Paenibacillus pini]GAF06183.1 GGDEF domain protein [Paenibacillus pini JCM 16418]
MDIRNDKNSFILDDLWHRKIFNAYWIMTIMFFAAQAVFLLLNMNEMTLNLRSLISNGLILGMMLVVECWLRFWDEKYLKQVIVGCGFLMSYLFYFIIEPTVDGAQMALLLPVLISVVYFNRRMVYGFGIVTIFMYALIYFTMERSLYHKPFQEFIQTESIFIVSLLIGRTILIRVKEFMVHLESVVKSEQQLMVEKTISDKMIKIDALTGLYNHKTFHEYLEVLLEHCEKNDLFLQVAIMDIDNFKKVNDTYGHWVGDLVLKEVAAKVSSLITPNDFAARYGGEEFAVIFADKTLEETEILLESIREEISLLEHSHMMGKPVTVSIGLCAYHIGDAKEALFRKADNALYIAKRTGKNKVVTADDIEGKKVTV